MIITLRLDKREEKRVRARAKALGITAAEFVRGAIAEKLQREVLGKKPKKTPYEAWLELGVDYASGETDRSERVDELVAEAIAEKHRARRSDR